MSADPITLSEEMYETPGGILVPLKDETWTQVERKAINRFEKEMRKRSVDFILTCKECEGPLSQILDIAGRVTLKCHCTIRTFRGV